MHVAHVMPVDLMYIVNLRILFLRAVFSPLGMRGCGFEPPQAPVIPDSHLGI